MTKRCFACGKKLGANPVRVDTRDDQTVFVGRECAKLIMAAGESGYQSPLGGPKLYPLPDDSHTCEVCFRTADEHKHPCRFEKGCSCWYGVPCSPKAATVTV